MPENLIVRLPNWLGDTVMAVPALQALRAARPAARVLLAGPWVSLFTGQSLADVLVDYPRAWGGRLRTADTVRSFGGETAILLPNSFESALAARYWGARRRIGFTNGIRAMLLTDRVAPPAPRPHQIDEYLMLVEHLDIPVVEREPRLREPPPESEERRTARDLFREAGGAGGRTDGKRIAIHLGAAYGSAKQWPLDRVIGLCRMIHDRGDSAVLLGTADEAGLARAVMAEAPAVSLAGRTRAGVLPAVLSEVDALVSGDTGVAHLAAALGTPVTILFGPTDPSRTAPRGPATVVRHPVPCAPCLYRVCPIEHPCLRGIEPREVLDAVTDGESTTARRRHRTVESRRTATGDRS